MTTHNGFKFVDRSLTAGHRYAPTQYLPGTRVKAPGPFTLGGACPSSVGDGICIAKTWRGAQSGGAAISQSVCVLVSYDSADILGEDEHKARVRKCKVLKYALDPQSVLAVASADLRSANLRSADLRSANLRSANLYGANLYGANLYGANLYGADLRSANLRSADLRSANLRSADLRSARGNEYTRLPADWTVSASGLVVPT